ncbi:conserved membrane hypothetical protein [Alteromonas sp. 38]|uniref:hypothetical protein n=1 Tax=unclassified Alteromonas TaxID=2614992 RepID=UPI0012F107A4|nr:MULTISPECIES: hypothetical protein [unclassified Alteromonas]CAD5264831.1 conserved membrane hypothetical protein [Alteromonas sp. 154]VXC13915.1 conserved membrane hypothetical protein [Alteromonas sp. 38]
MRKAVRFRVLYLLFAIATYTLGFILLPETINSSFDQILSAGFLFAYFIVLPALFWYCVIKVGEQKKWKIIIPFSLASVVARYSMPVSLASYFEFLSWVRYPVIAILLIIEFVVIFHVVSMLWKSRKIKGDPRINALINNINEDDKKREVTLIMASEPASWYYAIPKFTKAHTPALANLSLLSAKRWHFALVLLGLVAVTCVSYSLLILWSEIAAIIVASVIFYGIISVTASHRISRHFSVYCHNNHLIVNASFFSLLFIPLTHIQTCEAGEWECDKEQLKVGRGTANIKLTFSTPVYWFTLMGTICERPTEVYLCVDAPNELVLSLSNVD